MRSGKTGVVLVHIVACLVFLSLPVLLAPPSISREMLGNPHTLRDLTAAALAIVFFYANYFWLIPALYAKRKYWLYGFAVAAFFCVIALLPLLLFRHGGHHPGNVPPPHRPPPPGMLLEIGHNLFIFLAVLFVSLTLSIRERLKRSEEDRLNAELSYLRAQINPHFLFNTLNSIYSLAIQRSEETATAIVKLSRMMRYITTETHRGYVSLEKELEYIRSYVELQELRLGNTVRVEFSIEGDPGDREITPLVLITFVENAFKYGVNPEEDSRIRIRISIALDELLLDVANNKVHLDFHETSRSGLGLKNAKHRLELSYPGTHRLEIRDTETEYRVKLHIHLDGNDQGNRY
jgi:two-component sensor histidine kinase